MKRLLHFIWSILSGILCSQIMSDKKRKGLKFSLLLQLESFVSLLKMLSRMSAMTRVSVCKVLLGNHQLRFEAETFKMTDSLLYQNADRPLCIQSRVTYVTGCHRLTLMWTDVDIKAS